MRGAIRLLSGQPRRLLSSGGLIARYDKFGRPQDVIKLESLGALGPPGTSEVAIKMLAAPINPADINTVEGVYGIKNPLPSTPGNEGVAVVEQVGSGVTSLRVGDWVIPIYAGFGTWRSFAVVDAEQLIRVPNDIPVAYAATMTVNPATAYRMLRDFAKLKPGDVVMQNGANSAVGLCVIQMARLLGLKTINIVRNDRPNVDGVLRLLTNLGGDVNVTDTYVNTPGFNDILRDLGGCKLAFNCVGGELVTEMARSLSANATIVTYGGMSKRPMNVPFDRLTAKQLTLAGFWVTEWYKTHSRVDRAVMIADIAAMMRDNQLTLFTEMHDFDDFHHALSVSLEPFSLRKVLLRMDHPNRLAEHDALPPSAYQVFETTV